MCVKYVIVINGNIKVIADHISFDLDAGKHGLPEVLILVGQ